MKYEIGSILASDNLDFFGIVISDKVVLTSNVFWQGRIVEDTTHWWNLILPEFPLK